MLRSENKQTRGRFLSLRNRNNRNSSTTTAVPSASASSTTSSTSSSSKLPTQKPMTQQPHNKTETERTRIATPVMDGFSQYEIEEFKEAFSLFDVEGKGSILVGPFRAVLTSFPKTRSYPHLERILDLLSDKSDDETLDFNAYLSLMAGTGLQSRLQRQVQGGDDEEYFQHVFELFDVDGKGYITVEDLERIALELGEHDMTREELEEMMECAHCPHKGKVRLQEFTKIMTRNLFRTQDDETTATDQDAHDK